MSTAPTRKVATCLTLDAESAADLMTPNPISIRDEATIQDAIALLTDRGVGAAPVINAASRPIGVISWADILIHQREQPAFASGAQTSSGQDPTWVRDLMTPAVFSVHPDAPAFKVIQETAAMNVQQLFVVDQDGVLIGVIGTLDILKRLHP
jgi:CBS-domain-containing membrane protein